MEWRACELERAKIASYDSMSYDNDYDQKVVLDDEKNSLMIEAIFRMFFSEFDFKKYEKDYDEMSSLYDDDDFGERYQELDAIFKAHNYKDEFYKFEPKDEILDALADRIAEKVIKKIEKKGS